MKFGGALLENAPGFIKVANLVEEFSCEPLVVVVSAIGKSTNELEKLVQLAGEDKAQDQFLKIKTSHIALFNDVFPDGDAELSNELSQLFDKLWDAVSQKYESRFQAYDSIVSMGEELSSCLFSHYLKKKGVNSTLISARSIIKTDNNFTDASVDWHQSRNFIHEKVIPVIDINEVVVTQGFIASDSQNRPTTLGREGSDFTAAIIGNVIDANDVTIWKNVPGLMNADPARFENVTKIDNISYHEAIELAYYGASVIHPKTIQPLKEKQIPLYVRPYYDPTIAPSVINNDVSNDKKIPSIIIKDDQVLLSIATQNLSFIAEDNLHQIFAAFSSNKIHINLMQNSAVSFSVAFNEDKDKLDSLLKDLTSDFLLRYNSGLQLITIRHYNDELIDNYVGDRKVFLVQKSRATVQVLVEQ